MKDYPILIVDDEKNIRLTMSQSLRPLGIEIETAVNGEEAFSRLHQKEFGLILLDLKMPGMGGMEALRQIRENWPEVRIIIITAHGSIESAVEAMKLGAVDFIRKPFAPAEIRELVSRVLNREKINADKAEDYDSHFELAKRYISDRRLETAAEHLHKALAVDPARPEAFNLLGVIMEIKGDHLAAQKNYRAAFALDPTYKPARQNLDRSTERRLDSGIILDNPPEGKKGNKKKGGK